MKRGIQFVTGVVLTIVCTAVLLAAAAPSRQNPKLVLAIIIDEFRYDYLQRFRNDYNSGLARLLDHGAVFTEARYIHAVTVTAVGHSTFLSGAPPSVSGIIANEWYDRDLEQSVTSVFDPTTRVVGGIPGAKGSSPNRMLVSTVADEVKIRSNDSKVIGVSIKDRGAILPAGHGADAAYWYDPDSNHWVTSTFYLKDLPAWVQKLNDEKVYARHLGESWFPFDDKDESTQPFCTMTAGTPVRYCGGLEATPWGNEMIEQFAERAITGENLGHHSGTDILTISFSSNDYIGHTQGPDDPAVRDISIRTDRLIGKLMDYADRQVGAGNTLVVLTADHGVAPIPEVNQARKMPGGRLNETHLAQTINNALNKRFGAGKWLMPGTIVNPYLNLGLIQSKKLDPAEVERVAADAAMSEKNISRVYTRHDLISGRIQQDPIGHAQTLSFYAPRSGDVFILPEPYYLIEATGTSHGTPYDYDTHVPVIFYGPHIKTGEFQQSISVNDIAPTLSNLLGVQTPSGSIGHVLSEIFE